jgi:hypothetical protein
MRATSVFKAVSSCRYHRLSIEHYGLRARTHLKPRKRQDNLRVQVLEIRAHSLGVEMLLDNALRRIYLPLLTNSDKNSSSTAALEFALAF